LLHKFQLLFRLLDKTPDSILFHSIINPTANPQDKAPDLDWFPRLRCMSLQNTEDVETEQYEMKDLQQQLLSTNNLVKNLSIQLNELKERVRLSL